MGTVGRRGRWIGYGVSAVAVGVLASLVDWSELGAAFGAARPAPLALATALLLACYLAFALRWRALLGGPRALPLGAVFGALMTGYLANLLFPLRPGDLLRALLIDRRFAYGKLKALTSVGLERVFDLGTLCALGFAALAWVPEAFMVRLRDILGTTLALVGVAVLLVTALVVLGRAPGATQGPATLARRVRGGLWRVRTALLALAGDSRGLPLRLVTVTALSLLGWGCFVAAMIACVAAFAPGTVQGAGLVLTVVTNLGAAIPSSPAGVGVYHALAVMTLMAFGVPAADALATAIVSHGLAVVTQAGLGLAALASAGGWRTLQEARCAGVAGARPGPPGLG